MASNARLNTLAKIAPPEQILRRSGLRRTPVRVGVLKVLAGSKRPLDVPAIVGRLPGAVDAVTVYRTLNTFTRKKLVHRVRGEDRSWRYAAGTSSDQTARPHEHPHFVCDDCGAVECLQSSKIPTSFVRSLGVKPSYAIEYPEVVLHGRCPQCR